MLWQACHHLVESRLVGVWIIDADGATRFMNQRMRSILDLDDSVDVRSIAIADVVDVDPEKLRLRNGTTVWAAIEVSPIYDDTGRFEGSVALAMDITKRKLAEEDLRESEARYRTVFEASPLAKLLVDVETRRFIAVNNEAVRMYGVSHEQLLSMSATDLYANDPPAPGHSGRRHEIRKDGTTIFTDTTAQLITVDKRQCLLVTSKDITTQVRLEEQFRQAQKLEAVGRLAGGVAHDFNNALSVVLACCDELLEEIPREHAHRELVADIRRAAVSSAGLTRQLLAFSRKQVLQPRAVSANEILVGVEKMLRRVIGEDVELVIATTAGAVQVCVDVSSIEQVLMNLVVNARDAMPSGGRLTLETANVVLDDDAVDAHGLVAGEYVVITVTDTGTGMDATTQTHAFDPFFTTKPIGQGTGLGLATVLGIVQQNGGGVSLASEIGRGTSVRIYLPRAHTLASNAPPKRVPTALAGRETVLVVEDDEAVRASLCRILRARGFRVVDAPSGHDALRIAEQLPIDLLLTDVVMPHMNGPELAERFAALRPDTPVVCMSGYADDRVVRNGFTHFVQKPVSADDLVQKVRDVLDA